MKLNELQVTSEPGKPVYAFNSNLVELTFRNPSAVPLHLHSLVHLFFLQPFHQLSQRFVLARLHGLNDFPPFSHFCQALSYFSMLRDVSAFSS